MHKSILSFSFALGLAFFSINGAAFAQQTIIRTSPNGNSQTTNRTWGNGQQTTTRTGYRGNSQTTTRTINR
jgi:hypothetical protein